MSEQLDLVPEHFEDTLRDAVRVLGGAKKVGAMLWQAKPADEAKNAVNDCCNPNNKRKFSYAELMFILRRAREAGYHGAMFYLAGECGYSAVPVDPVDEQTKLQREYIAAVKQQQQIVSRMERLFTGPTLTKAA